MQQIKGAVLKSRLGFIEEHFGTDGVAQVLASLPPTDRTALRLILPVVWYPFDLGGRLDDAIVRELAGGDTQVFERLGEASAQRNLTTVHSGFLRAGQPHALLERSPSIFRLYYEKGRREYKRTGPTSGVLTTHDAEAFSVPDCLTIVGWHRKALELCGARGVQVRETECRARGSAVCRYEVSWA